MKKPAPTWPLGPLNANKPAKVVAKHHPMREVEFDPAMSNRVCNASQKGRYTAQPDLNYRGQGTRLPSRGPFA